MRVLYVSRVSYSDSIDEKGVVAANDCGTVADVIGRDNRAGVN